MISRIFNFWLFTVLFFSFLVSLTYSQITPKDLDKKFLDRPIYIGTSGADGFNYPNIDWAGFSSYRLKKSNNYQNVGVLRLVGELYEKEPNIDSFSVAQIKVDIKNQMAIANKNDLFFNPVLIRDENRWRAVDPKLRYFHKIYSDELYQRVDAMIDLLPNKNVITALGRVMGKTGNYLFKHEADRHYRRLTDQGVKQAKKESKRSKRMHGLSLETIFSKVSVAAKNNPALESWAESLTKDENGIVPVNALKEEIENQPDYFVFIKKIKNATADNVITSKELEAILSDYSEALLNGQKLLIAEMKSRANEQLNLNEMLFSYLKNNKQLENKRHAELERNQRVKSEIAGIHSGFFLISEFVKLDGNEKAANQIMATGDLLVNFATAIENHQHMMSQNNGTQFTEVMGSVNLIGVIFSAFKIFITAMSDQGDSDPLIIIQKQIRTLAYQMYEFEVRLSLQFSRLDKNLRGLHQDVKREFEILKSGQRINRRMLINLSREFDQLDTKLLAIENNLEEIVEEAAKKTRLSVMIRCIYRDKFNPEPLTHSEARECALHYFKAAMQDTITTSDILNGRHNNTLKDVSNVLKGFSESPEKLVNYIANVMEKHFQYFQLIS